MMYGSLNEKPWQWAFGEFLSIIPILFISGLLEVTVFSRLHILYGAADLVMIVVIVWTLNEHTRHSLVLTLLAGFIMSFYSALPMNGYFLIYLSVWALIRMLRRLVWQMPLILLLFVTIVATMMSVAISFGILFFQDVTFDVSFVITQIFVPSMTLNLLVAFPTYGLLNDYLDSLYRVDDTK